jgi:hypothetical protein
MHRNDIGWVVSGFELLDGKGVKAQAQNERGTALQSDTLGAVSLTRSTKGAEPNLNSTTPVDGVNKLNQSSLPYSAPTITVDGIERQTTDSPGKQIAQTEQGLINFWRWFGDSKVVDKDGKPLVVHSCE